jgi:multidrug efflux pump subunit AcrA (membrane-fusion protein)
VRLLLLGVAVVVGGAYVAIAGNPLNRGQPAPTYQTATLSQGSLRLTVSATGPISNPQSVPLSFKSSGTLTEVGVGGPSPPARWLRVRTRPTCN